MRISGSAAVLLFSPARSVFPYPVAGDVGRYVYDEIDVESVIDANQEQKLTNSITGALADARAQKEQALKQSLGIADTSTTGGEADKLGTSKRTSVPGKGVFSVVDTIGLLVSIVAFFNYSAPQMQPLLSAWFTSYAAFYLVWSALDNMIPSMLSNYSFVLYLVSLSVAGCASRVAPVSQEIYVLRLAAVYIAEVLVGIVGIEYWAVNLLIVLAAPMLASPMVTVPVLGTLNFPLTTELACSCYGIVASISSLSCLQLQPFAFLENLMPTLKSSLPWNWTWLLSRLGRFVVLAALSAAFNLYR
ncbi:putative transmembrane protein [Gregarina niphandrodes]|uniref:Transmembrane protein n=1 Tax=Gregarina niphandrodes TaxID=110365 RepID=A0A023B4L1_GRENI|nr:putative transmembrane protein [Gregarina niphandrodes]EZG56848.1 putative transmembrane protein [Gregarina niphandrodes]|eukprot:XP_011131132.1 putative transmembrane protein [Gregarina niphandrodes]